MKKDEFCGIERQRELATACTAMARGILQDMIAIEKEMKQLEEKQIKKKALRSGLPRARQASTKSTCSG